MNKQLVIIFLFSILLVGCINNPTVISEPFRGELTNTFVATNTTVAMPTITITPNATSDPLYGWEYLPDIKNLDKSGVSSCHLIFRALDGSMWFLTTYRIWQYKDKQWLYHPLDLIWDEGDEDNIQEIVYDLTEDSEGNIWASADNGIWYFTQGNWKKVFEPEEIPGGKARTIDVLGQEIWIYSGNPGEEGFISRYDGKSWYSVEKSFDNGGIRNFYLGNDGSVYLWDFRYERSSNEWVYAGDENKRLDLDSIQKKHWLRGDELVELYSWHGMQTGSEMLLDNEVYDVSGWFDNAVMPDDVKQEYVRPGLWRVRDLAISPEGIIWAVDEYSENLYYWDGEQWMYSIKTPTYFNWIGPLAFDSEGGIWLGTMVGLYYHPPLED